MEIEQIYPPYIYSIKYDQEELNEFARLFQQWNDLEYLLCFMTDNQQLLKNPPWSNIHQPEDAVRQVLDEAADLEDYFDNTAQEEHPNFDEHFKYLEGKYKYELEYPPMKSYGSGRPPLLRIYAIRLQPNTYLITGGGIKLADTIQNSPYLKDHILQDIDKVRSWLRANGIKDSDDMDS